MEWLIEFLNYKLIDWGHYKLQVYQLFIIVGFYASVGLFAHFLRKVLLRRYFAKKNIDRGRQFAFFQIFRYLAYITIFLMTLEIAGFNITYFLAGSAALLVGIGIGLQDFFNNLVTGILLLFEGNIKIGNYIEVGDYVGRVRHIGLRSTKIETTEGEIILIPNAKFGSEFIRNYTGEIKSSRFNVRFSTSYGVNPERVKELVTEVCMQHVEVEKDPPPFVRFQGFGESGLDFSVYFWSFNHWEIEDTKSDIRYKIFEVFQQYKIEIPYPKRDLFIKELPKKWNRSDDF